MGSIIKEGKENSNYFLSADCDFCIFGKDCCAGGCDIHIRPTRLQVALSGKKCIKNHWLSGPVVEAFINPKQ